MVLDDVVQLLAEYLVVLDDVVHTFVRFEQLAVKITIGAMAPFFQQ